MIAHDATTRDGVIESYRYLCLRGARKFLRRGLERRDLEQVAAIGLIKACDRYDASCATPFEAYAWLMIVGELMHHVRDFEHLVRMPRCLRRLEKLHAHAQERLMARLEREPTDAEIADEIGAPIGFVRELERARHAILAGAYEAMSAGGRDLDAISCVSLPRADDRLLAERALKSLAPLERRVVLAVYALGMTQTEIARRVGLTARQIYRIHRNALSRMRAALDGLPN
jgi:RNA polymerase sigma-B factor